MSVLDQVINKVPMQRQVQGMHMFQKAKKLAVRDKDPVFVEEKILDVDEVALTGDRHEQSVHVAAGTVAALLQAPALRRCVHFRADSAFGPYWSVTLAGDDIIAVDKDFETFSAEPQIVIGTPPEGLDVEMFIAMDPAPPRPAAQRGSRPSRRRTSTSWRD